MTFKTFISHNNESILFFLIFVIGFCKLSSSKIWVQLLATLDKLLTLLEQHREVHFNEGMPEEEENLEVSCRLFFINCTVKLSTLDLVVSATMKIQG